MKYKISEENLTVFKENSNTFITGSEIIYTDDDGTEYEAIIHTMYEDGYVVCYEKNKKMIYVYEKFEEDES